MSTTTAPAPRRDRPQTVLEVLETAWLSPHLVRVVAGGDGFAAFTTNEHTDKYVKIYFAKPELGLEPPYDVAALRDTLAPEDVPVTRTYTVRWVDEAAQRLAIDFVVHGDEGLAGPWAARAKPGDRLVLSGPGGGYLPDPAADWHLLAGDDSALPAIAAAQHPGDLDAVADLPWREGRVHVFAHGERGAVKALRRVFTERGVPRSDLSLSGYWAYGRAEDRFQAEKREPVGQIFED